VAWEGYPSRLCKCNNFNVNGLFGRDRLAEFGCSYLKSGTAGYMFPFVVRCAIILPMHRAKGVRP
jgi:hypothetical protein